MQYDNGADELINSAARIIKTKVNLGDLAYFNESNLEELREVKFHEDHWVSNFPRIRSLNRILDALEMNMFLEHRYKGSFMPPKRGGKRNTLGGASLVTINSIANSLLLFLQWIEKNNVDWHEVCAVSGSEKAKYWLPIYLYRKYLIERILSFEIDRDSANLYINHIRQLYEWALKESRIQKLPFKYKTKVIKKIRKDGAVDLLFTNYTVEEKGIIVTTTDLIIPKKYKQKKGGDSELSPYSKNELEMIYSTSELEKVSQRLKVDMALHCGLRAEEVASFSSENVVDIKLNNQLVYFVEIEGKFGKERTVMISNYLMSALFNHKNSLDYQQRLSKWQLLNGSCQNAPLFLNRSGKAVSTKSVSNIISKIRKELAGKSLIINRNFHDLRSTFATNLAGFMLSKHLPTGFIQFKLMDLMGHSNFSTTQKYINFARSITFDNQMAPWVDQLYGDYLDSFQENAQLLKNRSEDEIE